MELYPSHMYIFKQLQKQTKKKQLQKKKKQQKKKQQHLYSFRMSSLKM